MKEETHNARGIAMLNKIGLGMWDGLGESGREEYVLVLAGSLIYNCS